MQTNNTLWGGGGFITFNVNESGVRQTLSTVIFNTQYVANPVALQTEGPSEKPLYLCFVSFLQ
jgi:hypothetical protein